MLSIKNNCNNEIIINKSKFITELIKINNEADVEENVLSTKKKYPGATHYCYAYVCNKKSKYNDDGEPSKTAGSPILNVLESNNLNNILCVVIRYFGGIKLGVGGLVRAYTKSTTECIKKANIVNLIEGKKIKIIFSYDNTKQIDYLLKDIVIENKEYNDFISYTLSINNYKYNKLHDDFKLLTNEIIEIENIFIEE